MGYTVELNQIFCAASEQAGQKLTIPIEPDCCAIGLDATALPLTSRRRRRRERELEGAALAADGPAVPSA
jgi:hypothetical protein